MFCNAVLGVLHDVRQNCVLWVDAAGSTTNEYDLAVSKWPVRFRKPLEQLLKDIARRNRYVKLERPAFVSRCAEASCSLYSAVVSGEACDASITPSKCRPCHVSELLHYSPVEISEYHLSRFAAARRTNALAYANGKLKQPDFERRVLSPIFRYAKHVKIFDRYIGRSVVPQPNGAPALLKPGYQKTLEWFISVFQRECRRPHGAAVEIYCGWQKPSRSKTRSAVLALRQYQTYLNQRFSVPISIRLKKESNNNEMTHARYLVTDQASFTIDRGMDLLWDDTRMQRQKLNPAIDPRPLRDFAISYCEDCSGVDSCVRALPNLL